MWKSIRQRLREVLGGRKKQLAEAPTDDHDLRLARLRKRGVRIGEGCRIYTEEFSTEPFLVELGRHVGVAGGTQFITHDGAIWLARDGEHHENTQHVGRIVVGDNTFIGQSCILLPGARIGTNCVIGAGSVVRGHVPDNSVFAGNPGRVIGQASLAISRMLQSPDTVESLQFPEEERRAFLEKHFGLVPEGNQS
jgi:acetyltransferase-like isoleucine patch superfamily enzyme